MKTKLPVSLNNCTGTHLFVAVFLGYNQYWPDGFMVLWCFLCAGAPEDITGSGPGFKASQKTGPRLKVSSDRLREAGNRTCNPWFTRHRFIPYTTTGTHFSIPFKCYALRM